MNDGWFMQEQKRKKVFFILGSGGHTAQMLILQKGFSDDEFEKYFIVGVDDSLTENKVRKLGYCNIYHVDRYKRTEETIMKASIRNIIFLKIVPQLAQSIRIVRMMDRDLLITAGPNLGIFVFIFAKLRNNYCVFIESWSRRKKLSKTARLLKPFSNLFFVQWEEMVEKDESYIYEGRVA